MTEHRASAYRYGAVNRQMHRVANDHQRHLRQVWIDRVLNILDSDNLIAMAGATTGKAEDGLLFDCNCASLVWDDPRVAYRLQQLGSNDIAIELVDHEHSVAGKTFKRTQIKVTF